MIGLVDARSLPPETRSALARRLHGLHDVALPVLQEWNYGLCRTHRGGWPDYVYHQDSDSVTTVLVTDRPCPACPDCGLIFRRHQRVSIPWLYYQGRALLADATGSGKTTSAAGLLAILKETGELSAQRLKRNQTGRALVVVRAPALYQWRTELNRMLPRLSVEMALGAKAKRRAIYVGDWEVLLISPQTLINDHQEIDQLGIAHLLVDDVDALRHRDTQTAYVVKRLARKADRFVVFTATPLQKKLHELHSVLECMGGFELFGTQENFTRRYEEVERVKTWTKGGKQITREVVVGTRNLDEFRARIAPLTMRRTAADFDDVEYPTLIPSNVFLELYPAQRARYATLRSGVLEILKATGKETKTVTALTQIGYGAKICAGLAALGEPDGPGTSVKFDWLIDKLTGDLEDEKVVVFANIKNSVRALQTRFQAAGIDFVTIWGDDSRKSSRHDAQTRFQRDPACRVLIGTSAIEQSLNLQIARHLVNVDLIMNPARMAQLAGRIQRDGSAHARVFVHNLLTVDTQEQRYLPLLQREQALIDAVWGEQSGLFAQLDALTLLTLITG